MEVSRKLHDEVVAQFLARHFQTLVYAAARLDGGSDVLGFETAISRDHGWGPRLTLFLHETDFRAVGDTVRAGLEAALPETITGVPTRFPQPTADRPDAVGHGIRVDTIESFFRDWVGCDPRSAMTTVDWLAAPAHRLRTVIEGQVWHDDAGRLQATRERLRWYPDDLWRGLLAAQWSRLADQEAFMARCGDVGDDLGSRLVAARQVRELVLLAFLLDRTYPPYAKWLGRAFGQLAISSSLSPIFERVLVADDWHAREEALNEAYSVIGAVQNASHLAAPVDLELRSYHGRPYRVLGADRFADALAATLPDGFQVGPGAAWQWISDDRVDDSPSRTRAAVASQQGRP
jgi:hypothetical protein